MTDPNCSTLGELRPRSPCIKICGLDEHGFCRGCYRTIDEIAAWSRLGAAQQWRLIGTLNERAMQRGRQQS